MTQFPFAQVVAVQSLGGANPERIIEFSCHVDICSRHQALAVKDAVPCHVVKFQTVQSVVSSHIETMAVGRQRQLGNVVMRESFSCAVSRTVLPDFLATLGEHQQSLAHRSCPNPSLAIHGIVGDAEEIVLLAFHRMVLRCPWVNPSATFTIRANPDAALGILADGQYGRWEAFCIVPDEMAILVQTIDTVLVCAKPCVGFAVCKNAADICGADHVHCTGLMSHIAEA